MTRKKKVLGIWDTQKKEWVGTKKHASQYTDPVLARADADLLTEMHFALPKRFKVRPLPKGRIK